MTHPSDPDETREIRLPQPGLRDLDAPWWQTVNRDIPPPRGVGRPNGQERVKPPHSERLTPRLAPILRPSPTHTPPAPVPSDQSEARKSTRRRILLTAGIVLIVVEAVVIAVGLKHLQTRNTTVLDISRAQLVVAQVVTDPVDGYGAHSVSNVVCNQGRNPEVHQGAGFECIATVDGASRRIAVVFQDNSGTYAIDRPR